MSAEPPDGPCDGCERADTDVNIVVCESCELTVCEKCDPSAYGMHTEFYSTCCTVCLERADTKVAQSWL